MSHPANLASEDCTASETTDGASFDFAWKSPLPWSKARVVATIHAVFDRAEKSGFLVSASMLRVASPEPIHVVEVR